MKPSPVIIEYQRVCCLLEVIITGNGGALSLYDMKLNYILHKGCSLCWSEGVGVPA